MPFKADTVQKFLSTIYHLKQISENFDHPIDGKFLYAE